jgi:membrane-associated phospholipid phosphatase
LGCYLGMIALWCGVGEAIVHLTPGTALGNADQDIAQWFVDRRTPRLNTISLVGSMLSETAIKIAITAIVCLVLLWVFHRWFESLVIAVSLILEASVFLTVTLLVKRPRPDVPRLDGSPVSTSFPSGHVAAAVCYSAMAIVVFWHTRKQWIRILAVVVVTLVPIAVGLARMYRGMHNLTDVIAGAIIGSMSVALVTTILSRAERRRLASADTRAVVEASESPHPLIGETIGVAS